MLLLAVSFTKTKQKSQTVSTCHRHTQSQDMTRQCTNDHRPWPFLSGASRHQSRKITGERRCENLGSSVKGLGLEVLGPSPARQRTAVSKGGGPPHVERLPVVCPTEPSVWARLPAVSLINSQVGKHQFLYGVWSYHEEGIS